tara:strand:+ start:1346 stop:1600 length:255 start_codon:yes stop_codon:yes gene_type:complete
MIKELLKLKIQINAMIETYKDLHPDEFYDLMDNGEYITKEDHEKEQALKKIREGTYESTFRKEQGKETTEHGEGPSSLCVYGDS